MWVTVLFTLAGFDFLVAATDLARACEPFSTTDIPHCRFDFGAYASVKPRVRISEELEEIVVLFGQVYHHGPLPRDEEHMHPDNVVEHPARRGVLDRFAFLIGK